MYDILRRKTEGLKSDAIDFAAVIDPLTSIAAGPENPKCVNNSELRRVAIGLLTFGCLTVITTSSKVTPESAWLQSVPPTSGTNAGRVGTIE